MTVLQYVSSRAVVLAGDRAEQEGEAGVGEQLAAIISHIEDLEEVNSRVRVSDDTHKYMEPLLSEVSELRLDF